MEAMTQQIADRLFAADRIKVVLLILVHTVICCVSLAYLADGTIDTATFHILYDPTRLPNAVIAVAAFASGFDRVWVCQLQLRLSRGFYSTR